jgi:hypothetical protein
MGVWPHIEELVGEPSGDEFEGHEEVYKVNKPGNTLLQVPNAHGHGLEVEAQTCWTMTDHRTVLKIRGINAHYEREKLCQLQTVNNRSPSAAACTTAIGC